MRIPGLRSRCLASVIAAAILPTLALPAETASPEDTGLTADEQRGREIYLHGESSRGLDITAYVGQAAVEVPASALPCANCHGPDGLGRPEAGVSPSDITWSRLTRHYGLVSARGHRRSGPYDEPTLGRAILAGLDPSDNRLDSAMPRYRMSDEDLADLVAYLKRLDNDPDPGVEADKIVVGTVMPRFGPVSEAGNAAVAVLSAYFADLNEGGGVYGRGIELVAARADSSEAALAHAADMLDSGRFFALVAPVTAGLDPAFAGLAEEHAAPLIGPITRATPANTGLQRYTFHLFAGPELQARALVEFATSRLPDGSIQGAVVHPSTGDGRALAAAVKAQAQENGWIGMRAIEYDRDTMNSEALSAALRGAGVQAVIFLGGGTEFTLLAESADALDWTPYLFALGDRAGRAAVAAPSRFDGRLFVAYATSPSDQDADGRREFGAFHQRHGLPREHVATQVAAYAAAKLLTEGLSRTGRALTRERLVTTLEGLYRYETGLTPALTYSVNRHVGADGAHVVSVDLDKRSFAPGSTWVQL